MAVETAVNNFYNEYGSMPSTGDTDKVVDTAQDAELLNVLLGMEPTGGEPLNPRKIKFLSAKEGKSKKNGLIYSDNGNSVEGMFDPWGGGYKVLLDLDYDEQLDVPGDVREGGRKLNGRRVAVWSLGADGTKGTGGQKSDDVITWGQ